MASEFDRIAKLALLFGSHTKLEQGIELGIGDDAAVLSQLPGQMPEKLVWTVDAQVEGTHFRRDWVSWHDEGWRSFMAAASDLAAMGATPWCALSSLILPSNVDDSEFEQLARGQNDAAQVVGAPIVGGNLARGDEGVSITTTLLGRCHRALLRSGAKVGDSVWIAGSVGLAAAGLRALMRNVRDRRLDEAIEAWRRPVARIAEGVAIAEFAHASVDLSDGLVQDVLHIASASKVRIVIEEDALRAHVGSSLEAAANALGEDALELALNGGEDYAIVVTSDRAINHRARGFSKIGEVIEGEGLVLRKAGGTIQLLDAKGFDHFATATTNPGKPAGRSSL